MKKRPCLPVRQLQRGAVMIVFGASIFILFGFMALVIDLGRTYVVRTELQNAADAAALAGAKQLDQTAAGVCCGPASAVAHAIAMAAQNDYKFSETVTITVENISVGTCPDAGCMEPASNITSDALAAGKTFLKVDIPSGTLATFFARVPTTADGTGTASTSTFGSAVAGHYVVNIAPIGVCAIDPAKGGTRTISLPGPPAVTVNELTEFGFRRGIAYDLMRLGPLGANSTPYLLNPVDVYPGPPCDNSHSNATYARDFICTGTSAVIVSAPTWAFGSTGMSWGPVRDALNSRFDDFGGGANACDPTSAPPDVNVKDYRFELSTPNGGGPRDWMISDPTQQSISIDPATNKPVPNPTINQYGALWSYSRPVKAVGTSPNASAATGANATFTLNDWPSLYAGNTADQTASGYPSSPATPPFPVGTLAAPYNTSSGNKYFEPPSTAHPGRRGRRVLNIAIVDCPASSGNNCSSAIRVLSVGRFFMQRPAVNPSSIHAEFDGLVDPIPPVEIRLYK